MATTYTVPAVQDLENKARAAFGNGNADEHAYYLDLANAVGALIRVIEHSPRKNAPTIAKNIGVQLQQALRGI